MINLKNSKHMVTTYIVVSNGKSLSSSMIVGHRSWHFHIINTVTRHLFPTWNLRKVQNYKHTRYQSPKPSGINNCLNKLNELKFCEVSQILISNWTWKFQLSLLKNKKVLFLKKYFLGRTAKIHPKDGVCRLNFPEGFDWYWITAAFQVFGNKSSFCHK